MKGRIFTLNTQNLTLDLTQTIALIGCITGCLGLVINLYRLYRERYCLKIGFFKPECIFFGPITAKTYSSKYQGLIHMEICNKSVNPITIHDAYLAVGKHYSRFEKYDESDSIKLLQKNVPPVKHLLNPKSYVSFPMNKQFEAPLRLQAFDSFEGYGFIPYFPYEKEDPLKIYVIFKTAKRSKHVVRAKLHKFSD